MIIDRVGNKISPGDFIVYVTKTEAPSLQFAWVDDIVKKRQPYPSREEYAIKLAHANPDGTIKNKTVWTYNQESGKGEYVDTGKPSKSTLSFSSYQGRMTDNRLMKISPI